jgi:hypothetical protein
LRGEDEEGHMKRGFWVVLVLVGGAPTVALAQAGREQPAEQGRALAQVSNEALQQQITELWQGLRLLRQEVATLREELRGRSGGAAVAGVEGAGATSPAEETAQADSSLIVVELPAGAARGPSEGGAGRGEQGSRAGIGGGGPGAGRPEQAAMPPDADTFVGTVRSVTGDRLLMKERTGRIYELGVDEKTRVIGQDGRPASLAALTEGIPVRAVATEGVQRAQVRTIHILVPTPIPER